MKFSSSFEKIFDGNGNTLPLIEGAKLAN